MKLTKLIVILAVAMLGQAQAQDSATLKKIKDSGSITLGVRESSIPFSYLDGKQEYQGYSLELCTRIVASIQKQLGRSNRFTQVNFDIFHLFRS